MKNRQRILHNNNLEANTTTGAIITLQESLTKCQTIITFITVTTTMTTTNWLHHLLPNSKCRKVYKNRHKQYTIKRFKNTVTLPASYGVDQSASPLYAKKKLHLPVLNRHGLEASFKSQKHCCAFEVLLIMGWLNEVSLQHTCHMQVIIPPIEI